MKLKPKTARRLLLVGVAVVLLIVSALALVVGRSWQNERRTAKLRSDGFSAVKAGEFAEALEPLSNYLRRKPSDREAWLALAEAREKVEEPGGRHILQTAEFYERANGMDEADAATAIKLARLWNTIGKFPEARSLCERMRPADLGTAGITHIDFLIEEAIARIALKDPKQASLIDAITERLTSLDPDSYRALELRTSVLLDADGKEKAVTLINEAVVRKPDDARLAFLQQIVLARAGRTSQEQFGDQFYKVICKAAGLSDVRAPEPEVASRISDPTYTDPQFIIRLVASFDALHMHRHSVMVLKDAADRLGDADARRILARRLWQSGRPSELLTDSQAADAAASKQNSEVLGFQALALRDTGKPDQAKARLKILRDRERDFHARGWTKLLTAELETPDPKVALAALENAVKENGMEPTFLHFRGEALLRLRRTEEAREAWRSAEKSSLAVSWPNPSVRIAETLLDEGRFEEAGQVAFTALGRWPASSAVRLLDLRIRVASIEAGRPVQARDQNGRVVNSKPGELLTSFRQLGARLDEAAKKPEDRLQLKRLLTPAQVALLADDNRKPEAVTLVQQILDEPGLVDADVARRLSAISARTALGIEPRLAASSGRTGIGDAASVFERAMAVDANGKGRQAALKLLDDHVAASPADRKAEAAAVRAQFHDVHGVDDALDRWKAAIKEFPASLGLHLAALRANTPLADAAFVDQIAKGIIDLGGSDADRPSIDIRLARARALVHASKNRFPTPRDKADAVAVFRTLIAEAPTRLDIRSFLIDALLLESPVTAPSAANPGAAQRLTADYAGAIEQLAAVAPLAPNRGPTVLRLADILRRQGKIAESAAELSKLTLDETTATDDRITAIDRLADLREFESALRGIDLLLPTISSSTNAAAYSAVLLRKAGVLMALRRDREAADNYRLFAQQPVTSAVNIVNAAVALESFNDAAAVAILLAKLDSPEVQPVDRAMALALYASATGDANTAVAQYIKAMGLSPDDPMIVMAFARFHLARAGESSKAETIVRDALRRLPNNPDLDVLLQQILIASQGEDTANIRPLAEAMAKHPNPVVAQRSKLLLAMSTARENGSLDSAESLKKFAAEFADDSATQLLVARKLLAIKPEPRPDAAADLLAAAAARFPGDAAVQEQATRALIAMNRWDQAVGTASAWSVLSRQPAADLAVAEAQLALNRPKLAGEAVRSFILPAALADQDTTALGVLNVRVRAAILQGDSAGALRLVSPYLSGSAVVRTRIVLAAAASLLPDTKQVESWISETATHMDPKSAADQLALAVAYGEAATRLKVGAPALASRSAIAATAALAIEPASVPALITLGRAQIMLVRAAAGDAPTRDAAKAEAAVTFRKLIGIADLSTGGVIEVAAMAEQLADFDAAVGIYDRHIASPQAPTGFALAVVKNNLAFLMLQQSAASGKTNGLSKAKALVEESLKAGEIVSFLETLGAINAALNEFKPAINAYRRALKLDPQSLASKVGLAAALTSGSPAEREEALRLVKDVEKEAGLQDRMSEKRIRQLVQTRQRLDQP